jgi:O-antigen/teichoic acid export membrane protein
MTERIQPDLGKNKPTGNLLKEGLGTAAVSVVGSVFGLIVSVAMARWMGASHYGVYSYVFAVLAILASFSQFGLPTLLIRETSKSIALNSWQQVKGIWRWSFRLSLGLSLVMMVVCAILAFVHITLGDETKGYGLLLGVAAIPVLVASTIWISMLQGAGFISLSQIPPALLRPLVFISILGFGIWCHTEFLEPAELAILANIIALFLSMVVIGRILSRTTSMRLRRVSAQYDKQVWLSAMLPLGLLSVVQLINSNTDLLMLGWMGGNDEIGVYRVASIGGSIMVMGLTVINMVVGPQFSRLHAANNAVEMQRLAIRSARFSVTFSVIVFLPIYMYGGEILGGVYGAEFAQGGTALTIIAAGQLFNAYIGPVGNLLNMIGHERVVTKVFTACALLNVLLNTLLIPRWGIEGAAAATSISLVLWNSGLYIYTKKILGLETRAI